MTTERTAGTGDERRYPRLEGAAKERVLRSVRAALGPRLVKDHRRPPRISKPSKREEGSDDH
ncbi:MAG: hypothetical protein ACREK5_03870 [Gemmatimonadota bacterium]